MNTRLSPDDIVRLSTRPSRAIIRAATCHFIHRAKSTYGSSPQEIAAKLYKGDEATATIVKASVPPATTATSGWASQLVATSVLDFISSLSGVSAASRLLGLGLMVDFGGNGSIVVPGIAASANDAGGWVEQGAPIRVRRLTLSSVTLTPKHLKSISVISQELADLSAPTIENVLTTVLREATGLALDSALFSTAAASASQPAGLLNGVAGLTPAAASATAMDEDLSALASAVAGAAGAGPIVYVAGPDAAARIKLAKPDLGFEVLPSSVLAADTVVAIAPNALASAFDPAPRFDLSDEATLHQDDAAPAAISATGTPNTISAPVTSLFQQNLMAIRLVLQASFGLRTTGAVAHVSGVNW